MSPKAFKFVQKMLGIQKERSCAKRDSLRKSATNREVNHEGHKRERSW